jgi:hypothetical protein
LIALAAVFIEAEMADPSLRENRLHLSYFRPWRLPA